MHNLGRTRLVFGLGLSAWALLATALGARANEAPGPSSRKTPIVISEIMYRPLPRTDGKNLEFIEIYNSNPFFHDVSGYQIIADNLSYTFPLRTAIPGNARFVIAASPAAIQSVYGLTNVFGPYSGSLKKSGTLRLIDERGAELLIIPYSNLPPWPIAAEETGHSLVLANPTYGEADPRAWSISAVAGGSPGAAEEDRSGPFRSILINELMATSPSQGKSGFVELYNHSNQPVDLSGCILTDNPAVPKFVIPRAVIIPERGYLSFGLDQLGFEVTYATREVLYLFEPGGARLVDAVPAQPQDDGSAFGRWPDGGSEFYPLSSPSPGAANTGPVIGDIVINELMYDPVSGNDDDQYVELYNQANQVVDLSNWKLTGEISYTFPTNTLLPPDSYWVVARNLTNLLAKYPNLNSGNALGDFEGKLSHNGARVALTRPCRCASGVAVTTSADIVYVVEDEVTYGVGGRWGQWAAGGGSSLELINPQTNHRLAANWADSDETQKSAWVNVETTDVLDNGANYEGSIGHAQLGLLDVGECLVDNVEVIAGQSGANLVANPDFESGLNDWSLQGCFSRSGLEGSGYQSGQSLHLRCSDRLWTGVNSCEATLAKNALGSGQTATLRFKARWLHGWPELLLRLNGNWLEAAGALTVPAHLGSPGARNSRYVPKAAPAISDVSHSPALPAANEAIVVSARVQHSAGVESVTLSYRLDPDFGLVDLPMRDDGTGGDAVAGDGIYSATIPGQPTGAIVAFFITSQSTQSVVARFPSLLDDGAPPRECVVLFGDANPPGNFGVYHLWITQTNVTRWSKLSDLSNEAHDCTFVNGNRIIYNARGRFAGSPYHQNFNSPSGNLCHYKWIFPDDDKFLGATSFNKIHQPGNGAGDDGTVQREQLANTFLRALGVPSLNRRFVAVYVNGRRRGTLMEDAQTPDGDLIKEFFPNDKDGYLYKMQPWFEFAPFPSGNSIAFNNQSWCTLMPYYTSGGRKKTARYRYNYLVHRTPDSASNFEPVFALVDAANSSGSPQYVANLESLADMENWMRVFAANHAAGNWDSFGAQNAQNLYGYMGTGGTRYSLLMWDFNIVFGNSGSWGPGQNLFASNGADPNTARLYTEPAFRRMYWRALQELVDGPLDVTISGPLLDAKYQSIAASGLNVQSPSGLKSWLTSARTSIARQIAVENAANFTVNPIVVSNDVAILSGKAPFQVKSLLINNVEWPVTWINVTTWNIAIPLQAGTNSFAVLGLDLHGRAVPSAVGTAEAVYAGAVPDPVGNLVINEIMANPARPGAAFVELANRSDRLTFDLAGWSLPELSYNFPPGAFLGPNQFLVLAANRTSFADEYGASVSVFDTFTGTLEPSGQTLTLARAGTAGTTNLVAAKVRYENAPPWPVAGEETSRSLQLIDWNQDNSRVGNWTRVATNSSDLPQWQYVALTGLATKSTLLIGLLNAGDVYLDDIKLVAGTVPEAGKNYITNGDFESALNGSWTISPNVSGSALSSSFKRSGEKCLHLIATSGGPTLGQAVWQNTAPLVTNATYTLSYWYLPSTSGSSLLVRLSGSSPGAGQVYSLQDVATSRTSLLDATPGGPNSVRTSLAPFPPLWLNEVQAENLAGPTNNAGQRAPWIELYNAGAATLPLAGLYLANDFGALNSWSFPQNAAIGPHEFKVIFADGQSALSTDGELHTSFALLPHAGSVSLSRLENGQLQVVDYLNYTNLLPSHSYGCFPDGQSFDRQDFVSPTPGQANQASGPPLTVSINEWMASNTKTIVDPLGGNAMDWFELYNYGNAAVDLGGAFLSDQLTNLVRFQIPSGYRIPARGFLLVWADKLTTTASPDLHVNFKLDKAGSNLALFAPDGELIDSVSFGVQTANVSQGRFPDGSPSIVFMGPTPGTNNLSANGAVVLSDPGAQTIYPGETLRVGFQASSLKLVSPTFLYSLDPGAPSGVLIDENTGMLTWTLPGNETAGPRQLTVRASLGTLPAISATQTVTLTVLPALSFAIKASSGGTLACSWPSALGKVYRIEYSDNLGLGSWAGIGADIVGTGGVVSIALTSTNIAERFYRLALVP